MLKTCEGRKCDHDALLCAYHLITEHLLTCLIKKGLYTQVAGFVTVYYWSLIIISVETQKRASFHDHASELDRLQQLHPLTSS